MGCDVALPSTVPFVSLPGKIAATRNACADYSHRVVGVVLVVTMRWARSASLGRALSVVLSGTAVMTVMGIGVRVWRASVEYFISLVTRIKSLTTKPYHVARRLKVRFDGIE
jgi:hypothetical protein